MKQLVGIVRGSITENGMEYDRGTLEITANRRTVRGTRKDTKRLQE